MDNPRKIQPINTKNHEQTEYMNRPMTSMEIGSLIQNLPTNSTRMRWFQL